MSKKYGIRFFANLFVFFLLNIAVFLILCHKGIKNAFGKVTFEQILFNINAPLETIDPDVFRAFLFYAILYIVFVFVHICFFIKMKNVKKRNFSNVYMFVCIIAFAYSIYYIDKRYEIKNMYMAEKSIFIESNYEKEIESFFQKRNLILVFLESLEKGYVKSAILGKNLIPELEELAENNISFSGYVQTHGSGWTQAAHVNMLLGLPLRLPCITKSKQRMTLKEFLPKASSLPVVFHRNGYAVNIIMGSSSTYSDLNKFFKTHKFDNIFDRAYFDNIGYNKEENLGTGWGYKDAFIYERAFEEYKKRSSADKPFFLMLETIDTHLPHGYVEEGQKEFGDVRDAIRQSSIMCSNFVKKLYEYNNLHNTTVVIVGDHTWMMNRSVEFTAKMDNIKPREIYNVFINSCFSDKDIQTKRRYAPFDMAPTILEAVGVQLKGGRFGLGTSLFSKEQTLLEKHGVRHVNEELSKQSDFYLNLF